MLDRLFFIALVLYATGLFSFIAPQLGVSIGDVSQVMLALNCAYLAAKTRYALPILLHGTLGRWLLLFVLWPMLTMLYAPSFDVRELGVLIYLFTIFLGSVVYCRENGLPAMRHVLAVSLVITIIGMPLSMAMPGYFEAVAELSNGRTNFAGRPFGFLMQPNKLALSLGLMFLGWFALTPRKTPFKEVVCVVGFLGLELLTGSRAGVLVGVGVVLILLLHRWPERLRRGRLVLTAALLLAVLAVGITGLRVYLDAISDQVVRYADGDLIGRMQSMTSFQVSANGGVEDDISLGDRAEAQAHYIALIREKPWLGRGFGSDLYYREEGLIDLAAHSQAIASAFEYGILYPLVFLIVMAGLYFQRGRRLFERALNTNTVCQFVAAFTVLFSYAAVLDLRVFYIVFGLIYAGIQYPRVLFEVDPETGQPGAMLSRNQIQARQNPSVTPPAEEPDTAGGGVEPQGQTP